MNGPVAFICIRRKKKARGGEKKFAFVQDEEFQQQSVSSALGGRGGLKGWQEIMGALHIIYPDMGRARRWRVCVCVCGGKGWGLPKPVMGLGLGGGGNTFVLIFTPEAPTLQFSQFFKKYTKGKEEEEEGFFWWGGACELEVSKKKTNPPPMPPPAVRTQKSLVPQNNKSAPITPCGPEAAVSM